MNSLLLGVFPVNGMISQVVEAKDDSKTESNSTDSSKEVGSSVSTWKRDSDTENSDTLVRLMRDQLIMARAYANIAQGQGHYDLVRDLKLQIKEHTNVVGDANVDAELPAGYAADSSSQYFRILQCRDFGFESWVWVVWEVVYLCFRSATIAYAVTYSCLS